MTEWKKIEEGTELAEGFKYGPRKPRLPDHHHLIIHSSGAESEIRFMAARGFRRALEGRIEHKFGRQPTREERFDITEKLAELLGLERERLEGHTLFKWPGTTVERIIQTSHDRPTGEKAESGEKEKPPTELTEHAARQILLKAGFREVNSGRWFHPEHGRIEWHSGKRLTVRNVVNRIWRIQQALKEK